MRSEPLRLFAFTFAVAVAASCTNPRSEAATAQALSDAATEIGGLKNDLAQLQTDLDSLRVIVAKHDTVLTKIEAGIPK